MEPLADLTLVPVEPIKQMVLGLVDVALQELRKQRQQQRAL
jgi:hypothetical protein